MWRIAANNEPECISNRSTECESDNESINKSDKEPDATDIGAIRKPFREPHRKPDKQSHRYADTMLHQRLRRGSLQGSSRGQLYRAESLLRESGRHVGLVYGRLQRLHGDGLQHVPCDGEPDDEPNATDIGTIREPVREPEREPNNVPNGTHSNADNKSFEEPDE